MSFSLLSCCLWYRSAPGSLVQDRCVGIGNAIIKTRIRDHPILFDSVTIALHDMADHNMTCFFLF